MINYLKKFRLSILIIAGLTLQLKAQTLVYKTSFENFSDEEPFTKNSWSSEGFNALWVNGFDQNRAFIDNAQFHNGSKSLRILYPAQSFGPSSSGAQAPIKVIPADQYYISYWLRFSDNFSWGQSNEGGKLPGLAGGDNCSGCKVCNGSNGFTCRLIWRKNGLAVLYLYYMDKVEPCGDNFELADEKGEDLYFEKGKWYQVIERVKVNAKNNHDGEVEVWINQKPAISKKGIQFVNNGDKVDNFYFSTFHGGDSISWSPENDCYIWFNDIVISQNAADVFNK